MYNKLIVALVTQALKGIMIGMQRLSFVLCVISITIIFHFFTQGTDNPFGSKMQN